VGQGPLVLGLPPRSHADRTDVTAVGSDALQQQPSGKIVISSYVAEMYELFLDERYR
jgi:hypothetical protein